MIGPETLTWNKLFLSNFLKTLPLSSTKLLLIMMVRRALLLELMATLSVVAWSSTSRACRNTYPMARRRWGTTPICSRFLPRGSASTQQGFKEFSCVVSRKKWKKFVINQFIGRKFTSPHIIKCVLSMSV